MCIRDRFRENHGLPAAVIVAGPFGGGIANDGERLSLWRPATEDGGETLLDHVRFNDRPPWPATPDGGGTSLERISTAVYGNEAANWGASAVQGGTPGLFNTIAIEEERGGWQIPGDITQDGSFDLTDGIALLGYLFQGTPARLPCGDGTAEDPANIALLDDNGDGDVNLSDAVYILVYLFSGGPPPVLGSDCVQVTGCEQVCGE